MSSVPIALAPWRECPFIRGNRYRVRHDFKALRDSFTAGDILVFDSDAWSRYDGITGYFFRQQDKDVVRVWDIYDDDDLQIWREHFEELPGATDSNDA